MRLLAPPGMKGFLPAAAVVPLKGLFQPLTSPLAPPPASAASPPQELRPLDNPWVFGNYSVDYVSAGSRQVGTPAGGRFRTRAGKLLFRSEGLFQSVLPPDLVVNKVAFRLLGLLPGSVGLRGRLVSIPEREGGPDRKDTVKVGAGWES